MSNGSDPLEPKRGRPKSLSELSLNDSEIEVVADMTSAELEKFMNEDVGIYMHPAREKGELPVVTPNVNGINQPIIRGAKAFIKRKYVEALARCTTTAYEQQVPDPSRPEAIQMIDKTVPSYPFDVIEDSREGKRWLQAIYAAV